jgi:hypothetical protein
MNGAKRFWAGTRYTFAHLAACSEPKLETSLSRTGQFHGAMVLLVRTSSESSSMSWW